MFSWWILMIFIGMVGAAGLLTQSWREDAPKEVVKAEAPKEAPKPPEDSRLTLMAEDLAALKKSCDQTYVLGMVEQIAHKYSALELDLAKLKSAKPPVVQFPEVMKVQTEGVTQIEIKEPVAVKNEAKRTLKVREVVPKIRAAKKPDFKSVKQQIEGLSK